MHKKFLIGNFSLWIHMWCELKRQRLMLRISQFLDMHWELREVKAHILMISWCKISFRIELDRVYYHNMEKQHFKFIKGASINDVTQFWTFFTPTPLRPWGHLRTTPKLGSRSERWVSCNWVDLWDVNKQLLLKLTEKCSLWLNSLNALSIVMR